MSGQTKVVTESLIGQSLMHSETTFQLGDPKAILSDPMFDILKEALKRNLQLSQSKLSKQLGISERQVRKTIDTLLIQGKLIRVGSDTNGRWIFTE